MALRSKHQAGLVHYPGNLVDCVVEGCCAVVQVLCDCGVACLLAGVVHGVLEAGVHNVHLLSTVDDELPLALTQLLVGAVLDKPHQGGLAVLLPLLVQTAEAHMRQVLEPLEVGHGHTASIQQQIGNNHNPAVNKLKVRTRSEGAVCTLADDLCLDVLCIAGMDGLLRGCWDQDVAVHLDALQGVLDVAALGVALEGAVLLEVLLAVLHVQSVRVGHPAVVLGDGHDLAPGLADEVRRKEPYVAQPLHDHLLVLEPGAQAGRLLDLLELQEVPDAIVHTQASGLSAATHTTLGHGLAGHTGRAVHIRAVELLVRVLDPGHLTATSTHIRSRHIQAGPNEVLLAQLHSVAPGDALQLPGGELLGVDADATLCTAEGHVDHGTLVGHEGGQGLDLLQVHILRETDTALNGQAVPAVLRPVAGDDLALTIGTIDGKVAL
eukprot:comp24502_c0_seq1/m.46755 comp24502_c0_seq1/g.46755  ORF comp24502_c0_seq1/g.46755 comp24502_c0_seq1/m.46755 type:complete len:436 (+) comp24502_c0_seq1:355-1662(+)